MHYEGVFGTVPASNGGQRGADARDLAEPRAQLVDDVRTRRTEPAAAARRVEPPLGNARVGIGNERDVLHERREPGLADQSVGDGAGRERPVGRPPELVADERGHARSRRRREHRFGLRRVECERLLADHVTARVARLDRERGVRGGWRGDRDRVDTGKRERVGQRRARVRDAEAIGSPSGALTVTSDERDHLEACRPQRRNVHARAETGADNRGAGHALVPLVGIDDLAQLLAAGEAAEVVDEDVDATLVACSGANHDTCARQPHVRMLEYSQ